MSEGHRSDASKYDAAGGEGALDRQLKAEDEGLETREEGRGHGSAEPGSEISSPGGDFRTGSDLPVLQTDGCVPSPSGRSRREVLKMMALAAAAPAAFGACEPAADDAGAGGAGQGGATGAQRPSGASPQAGAATNPLARGDAWDPDLLSPVLRWEKVLTDDELESLAVLCDVIIPADGVSPSASAVGCHEYVDEWVSAPYDFGRNDLVLVRGGLVWLDTEAADRFGEGLRFRDLDAGQKSAICDDICHQPEAAPQHRMAARFFHKVRDLTLTAFYTTDEGMQDIGYVGNVPSTTWELPPPEVLRHLGLEDDV